MKKKNLIKYSLYVGVILLGIIADQLTKLLAVKFLKTIDTLPIWQGVLHLTYVENPGAAFGMLANHRWIFITLSTVAICALTAYLFLGNVPTKLYSSAICLIVSGGIGNMIDRLFLGYVIDFIDFRLINFAVFNTADSFVCIGAGLLILALILDIIKETKAEKKENSK